MTATTTRDDVTFHVDIPVQAGLVKLGDLRDLLEVLDTLPDNALLTVQDDGIYFEEPA